MPERQVCKIDFRNQGLYLTAYCLPPTAYRCLLPFTAHFVATKLFRLRLNVFCVNVWNVQAFGTVLKDASRGRRVLLPHRSNTFKKKKRSTHHFLLEWQPADMTSRFKKEGAESGPNTRGETRPGVVNLADARRTVASLATDTTANLYRELEETRELLDRGLPSAAEQRLHQLINAARRDPQLAGAVAPHALHRARNPGPLQRVARSRADVRAGGGARRARRRDLLRPARADRHRLQLRGRPPEGHRHALGGAARSGRAPRHGRAARRHLRGARARLPLHQRAHHRARPHQQGARTLPPQRRVARAGRSLLRPRDGRPTGGPLRVGHRELRAGRESRRRPPGALPPRQNLQQPRRRLLVPQATARRHPRAGEGRRLLRAHGAQGGGRHRLQQPRHQPDADGRVEPRADGPQARARNLSGDRHARPARGGRLRLARRTVPAARQPRRGALVSGARAAHRQRGRQEVVLWRRRCGR